MSVTLTLRAVLDAAVDLDGVTPDRTAALTETEIASLPIEVAGRVARVGDLFEVRGGHAAELRIEGDLSRASRVGAGMSGGLLEVIGSAGDDAGAAMSGGVLRVRGGAGHRLGAASPGASKGMSGGEIVIDGAAGSDAGARMRRGLVVIGGDAGPNAGRAMIAGTVVVLGRCGPDPCRGNKRGSLIAVGDAAVPPTYRYACTYEPPHVRLTMTYLRRTYGLAIADEVVAGRYRRYCGDAGEPGKGEILVLAHGSDG